MTVLIQCNSVSLDVRGKNILKGVSTNFVKDKINLVIGPNGAGKSTLLQIIAGLTEYSGGMIEYADGFDGNTKNFSYLPASIEIPFDYEVKEFLEITGAPETDLIQDLQLEDLFGKKLLSLSTGERQRVHIARVFTANKKVLILDEPFQNLDIYWTLKSMAILKKIVLSGSTVVLTTHYFEALISDVDLVTCLHKGSCLFTGDLESCFDSRVIDQAFRVSVKKGTTGHFSWSKIL